MDWIAQNTNLLLVSLNAVYAVVWVIYLQLFLMSYRRQRRSVILINRGASEDDRARCIVSNMGSEPIYVLSIIAELTIDDDTRAAGVTDREELDLDTLEEPLRRTTQGPLTSGEYLDVGSFRDLADRALKRTGHDAGPEDVNYIRIVVAAASSHASHLVAAERTFRREAETDGYRVVPTDIMARQLRGWRERRWIRQMLRRGLAA